MINFLKKYKLDIILIVILLTISFASFLIISLNAKKDNLIAKVYHHNEIKLNIDLENEINNEYTIEGDKGLLIIETKKNSIRVKKADCPHQDCVNEGWVSTTNKPIVCAHNGIYIILEGKSSFIDVEV